MGTKVTFLEDLGDSQIYEFNHNGKKGKIEVGISNIPFRGVGGIIDVVSNSITKDDLIEIYGAVLNESVNHV